jgi:thiamine-phosphate pyrophosphorylase
MNTRLYLITPTVIILEHFIPQLKQAFAGGDIACVLLRLPQASDDDILTTAKALAPIIHGNKAAFIISENIDLAITCGADGAHIGEHHNIQDGEVAKAKQSGIIIGASTHNLRDLAMVAGDEGADYVAFGPNPPLELISWWHEYTTLQSVAVGGVNIANCKDYAMAGADFVAMSCDIWDYQDGPQAAVNKVNQLIRG